MMDLVLSQVESVVVEFENQQEEEQQKEKEKNKTTVDYSWLVSRAPARRKKCLSIETTLTRNAIIDTFQTTCHEVIFSRPRPPTVARVLRKYLRSQSSANSVNDSPQPTSRSIGQLSIEELEKIV
ncbi:hypothetical protein WR25_22906 [Diploscapter pachys]|uniref:Uncharacterized protein n=1 Tax=Diploscapter pachys TaxID=2018661 RepID=A0A2A2L2M3_9BILA|nr:hypothetical protein WR25_22906 [Diploscapter pachys]